MQQARGNLGRHDRGLNHSSQPCPEQRRPRRANVATALSILLALALIVIAVRANVKWLTCLWMVLGGLGLQGGTNLLALAVAKPALQRRPWAVFVVSLLWPVVPVAIALYMAGMFTLIIKAIRAGWSAVVG